MSQRALRLASVVAPIGRKDEQLTGCFYEFSLCFSKELIRQQLLPLQHISGKFTDFNELKLKSDCGLFLASQTVRNKERSRT